VTAAGTNMRSLLLLLACLVAFAPKAGAGNLPFPKDGAAAKDAIAENCPTCLAAGVTLCGTVDVAFGKRFSRHFFAGTPKRGYLPGFRLSGEEFRALARSMSYDAVMQSLRQSFASLPLVVIDNRFAAARVIPAPASVDVTFPEGLHQCVRDAAKPWGCCIAADCAQECCEKSLGSPQIAVRWDDPESGDKVTFHFSHTLGASTLTRETKAGKTYLYWCIAEEPGVVQ
jgi:hypothetical protein